MTSRSTHHLGTAGPRRFVTASLLAGVLVLLGGMLLATADARGAVWEDVTCSLNGHDASTEGWSSSYTGTLDRGGLATNTCSRDGTLTARDQSQGATQTPGSGAEWDYTAPKGEPIEGGTVTIAALSGASGLAWLTMPGALEGENVSCFFSAACPLGEVPISKHDTSALYAGATCAAEGGEPACRQTGGLDAEVSISSAKMLLADNSRPTAAEVWGSILEKAASGTASLSLVAGDEEGPGIYSVVVKVDGDPVYDGTPSVNGGKCVTVGTAPGGSRQFEATQPCPQSVAISVEIPTSSFPDGQHTLTVEAEDAAGVTAVVYSAPITIENPLPAGDPAAATPPPERGPCNGTPCDEAARLTAHGQPSPFTRALERSAITLTGRLTSPTGAPIRDAQVKLLEQIVGSAAATQIGSATTIATGTWTFKVPKGPSRLLEVAYYSHPLDTVAAATLAFRESVQGALSMHAPRRAHIGRAVTLSGQLAGGYIPSGGESVQLEIFYAGRWRTIEVVRTNAKGRWTYRYVFTLGVGQTYRFRAVTLANGGYPLLPAYGPPCAITVVR
jgi:hypothetical protein